MSPQPRAPVAEPNRLENRLFLANVTWLFIWRKSRLRWRPAGRMAWLDKAPNPRQHHPLAVVAEVTRAQPGGKYLAVHARQLALEPGLKIL
jgi:hypothetical protein